MSDKIKPTDLAGLHRNVKLEASEDGSIPLALSSETPYKRMIPGIGPVMEVLSHEPGAINMERAATGLPMLLDHENSTSQLVGRIFNLSVGPDRVQRGNARFDDFEIAQQTRNRVESGMLQDVSVGYDINDFEIRENEEDPDGMPTLFATRWTPNEGSIVAVPADHRAGFHRAHEVNTMSDDKTQAVKPEAAPTGSPDTGAELKLFRVNQSKEREIGAKQELQRQREIADLFSKYESRYGDTFSDLRRLAQDSQQITVERAKDMILQAIADGQVSVDASAIQSADSAYDNLPNFMPSQRQQTQVQAGEDAIEKFAGAAENALYRQAGGNLEKEVDRDLRSTEFYSMTATDLAREYLRIKGKRASGDRMSVIGQALQRDGISGAVGHFPSILENVASKSLNEAFEQADETWSLWANPKAVPDFKTHSLLNTSLFPDLEQVNENEQYEHGTMSDTKETIKVLTYGRLFSISRQALANDDLSALRDTPMKMGAAAAYKIGDIVYAVLTTGTSTAMNEDSVNLFDASTHGNYVTAGAAPSVTTLDDGRTAMALQTDPKGKVLGIRPVHLIVPIALETTSRVLIAAQYDPAGSAGTLPPNPFQNTMQVVADHRLDTFNSSGWFLAARANTVTVGFLNGQQTPYLESRDGWSVDGVEYKVRIDVAATAADWRGLYYNDGVT